MCDADFPDVSMDIHLLLTWADEMGSELRASKHFLNPMWIREAEFLLGSLNYESPCKAVVFQSHFQEDEHVEKLPGKEITNLP